jgi:hypothetical protein
MYDKKTKIVFIGSTRTNIKDLNIDDVTYLDKKHGYEIINCHYLIDEEGVIMNTLDVNTKCGFVSSEKNNHVYIRYIGGLLDDNFVDTRTKKQQYSLYALLYYLHNLGYDVIVGEKDKDNTYTAGFDVEKETNKIDELWKWSDTSISSFRKMSSEIEKHVETARELIRIGKFKTKQDILNSKYAKIYDIGVKKFNNILDTHFNNFNELIEIDCNWGELVGHHVLISKNLFNTIQDVSKKHNLRPEVFFFTLLQENMCLYMYRDEWYRKIGKKKYTHPFCLFHAWSMIKKSFPVSKTTKILKKYEKHEDLNKDELIELLTAYILLYEESKTIHDFKYNTMWEDLYEIMMRGDYVCGLNYVQDKYQINYRNVRFYLLKDWVAEFKQIY